MTMEEAKAYLQEWKKFYDILSQFSNTNDEARLGEALDMAIEALSAEAEEYEDYEHATLVDIKAPLRASAEAVQGKRGMIPIELEKRYPYSRDEDITDAFMRGYQAHSEAVQGWIPVSEGLPSESGWYLITVQGCEKVADMEWYYGEWDAWNGVSSEQQVLAWMPLPTPYKGGDSE